MKLNMKKQILLQSKFYICLAFMFSLLWSIELKAQKIENVIFVVFENTVVVNYDLIGESADGSFEVELLVSTSSKGDYQPVPPLELAGDVGFDIHSGSSKSIQWQPGQSIDYPAASFQVKAKFTAMDQASKATISRNVAEETKEVPLLVKEKDGKQIDMVYVEGGMFQMGINDTNVYGASPVHSVTVSSFYIGKYEVTQKQWFEVMADKPSFYKGCDSCPVEYVSWVDVQQFIKKLNAKTHKTYRLPTEAEWEFAARGGLRSKAFAYSGSASIAEVAWCRANSEEKTHPVGQQKANELGIFDMTGNVWEWCSDWSKKYDSEAQTNPKGASSGTARVIRGGAWNSSEPNSGVAARNYAAPSKNESNIGFRLVLMP